MGICKDHGLPNREVKGSVDTLEWAKKEEKLIRAKDDQRTVQQYGGRDLLHGVVEERLLKEHGFRF